eukprot:3313132-Ditylum_brightwellii.AAC.1
MDQSATVNEEKMNNKMDEESVDDGVGHAEHKDNGNACYLKGGKNAVLLPLAMCVVVLYFRLKMRLYFRVFV